MLGAIHHQAIRGHLVVGGSGRDHQQWVEWWCVFLRMMLDPVEPPESWLVGRQS